MTLRDLLNDSDSKEMLTQNIKRMILDGLSRVVKSSFTHGDLKELILLFKCTERFLKTQMTLSKPENIHEREL